MYNASDIAKFIIDIFDKRYSPITNLYLQKILYFIQIEFIRQLDKPAFYNEIQAWRHGAVVPDVYYEYNKFVSLPIKNINYTPLDSFEKKHIDITINTIDRYYMHDDWDMVRLTQEDAAFQHCYVQGFHNEITIEFIKTYTLRGM